MKTLKYVLILICFFGLIFWVVTKKPKTEEIPTPVPTEEIPGEQGGDLEGVTKPIELCFAKFGTPNETGFYDRYTLRMLLDGEKVTGELNFLPAEKDSKVGEIKGTVGAVDKMMMARTANLWWYSQGEGMSVQEELKIIFGEGTASIGFAEMVDRGDGVYVYKKGAKINYTLDLTDVACSDFTERSNVEEYLKENLAKLSPTKPVLGGKWYYVSATINTNDNSGVVVYEDGHVQEKRNYTYSTDAQGVIKSLTIK